MKKSRNRLDKGLLIDVPRYPEPDIQDEYDLMRDDMLAELAPVGAVESMLARRVVSLAWRLRRAERMQDELTEDMIESHVIGIRVSLGRQTPKEPRYAPEYLALGQVAKKDWCGSRLIERLFEYERRLENSMAQAMAQLRQLKLSRKLQEAEAQRCAQAQKEAQLKKQSQSVRPFDDGGALPDLVHPTDEQLTAYAKATYGDSPPFWLKAAIEYASNLPHAGSSSPDGLEAVSGVKTARSGKKKRTAMSLPKL